METRRVSHDVDESRQPEIAGRLVCKVAGDAGTKIVALSKNGWGRGG